MDTLKPLIEDMDGLRWAEEFMDTIADKDVQIDVDLMLAWFCNAIMCGHDAASRNSIDLATKGQIEAAVLRRVADEHRGQMIHAVVLRVKADAIERG